MADVFISYARPNERLAKQAGDALRASGYLVWRDDELPAHRAYSEVIEERIKSAKAVLVLWSNDAVRSQWVRAEADAARELGTLVQVSIDGVLPPMPFNQIQCADLMGWRGDAQLPGWQKAVGSIASLIGDPSPSPQSTSTAAARPVMVCVPPFQNMSGDADQEYFSDGISEDIIVDLSKVSALNVVPRKTVFALKGRPAEIDALAREMGTTHFLEGSVRKAGSRVRIMVELLDYVSGEQVWAERYDRDLTDIFAIQDEISKAIVVALQVKLLPKEKKAIENRGTSNPDAYNLYLMARQHWVIGTIGDRRRDEVIIRICQQATAIDPGYSRAWALMALAQAQLRFWYSMEVDAMPAAERALALDPDIAEAYCVKARYLQGEGKSEEANVALAKALNLAPESWEVNKEAAFLTFRQGKIAEAIPYFEKAAKLADTDFHDAAMLITCYTALGDDANAQRAARLAFARAESAIAQDPSNGFALGTGAAALAALGEEARVREWSARAMLLDPDNLTMRYNLACSFTFIGAYDDAIDLLGPYANEASLTRLIHGLVDPDLKPLHSSPRYQALMRATMDRLGATPDMLPDEARRTLTGGGDTERLG